MDRGTTWWLREIEFCLIGQDLVTLGLRDLFGEEGGGGHGGGLGVRG